MTRLSLVRHGQSTWNAEERWQGQADAPLSPLGEHQAAAAALRVARVDAILSSDLTRAARTAEIIAVHLGAGPVRVDARLRERDAGAWTGLTRAEIEERYPGWLEGRRSAPGFEGDDALYERAQAALYDVATDVADGEVLVVTHGGLIRTVERVLGAPPERVPNLGGRIVLVDNGTLTLGPRFHLLDPDEETVPTSL